MTEDFNDNKLALKNLQVEKNSLCKEKTEALARLTACQKHREQMIATIEKQHQESLHIRQRFSGYLKVVKKFRSPAKNR